ncbi:hypothetical protein FCH28_29630 [Streptomyces piniterrae]|uniref:DUF6234 domain-containing protein n=1 Tax=Streptomyces piniterrae TaxID=2571125 RepID=A0A4V5MJ79_9ACTN|nr:DUF6234 family protein [Streptomyces piniterrae]TJZ44508.1 hypothetical protein FCH28_29630 [Streptomyces piniterrae]
MNLKAERTGRRTAVALAVIELAVLAFIGLSWASTYYWSWDPQHYGDPPGPYLKKAAVVPIFALVAAVVAAVRRVRSVAVGQAVMFVVICGVMLCAGPAGESAYEDSYRNACHAGVICDGDPSNRR